MESRQKILYPIGSYYPSQAGGPSNSVYWMCEGLKNSSQIETKVVTTNVGINAKDIILNHWYTTNNNSRIYTNSKGKIPVRMIWRAIREIKYCDILHLTSLFYPPSLIIALVNVLLYKKKMVVSVRGELDPYALGNFRPGPKKVILQLWKGIKNHLTFHSTVKEETSNIYRVFNQRAAVIELPNYLLPLSYDCESKNQTDLENNYFFYIGRLHPIKGIENVLHALSRSVKFNACRYKVLLAGKGSPEYEKKLKDLATSLNLTGKIQFLGQIEGKAKEVYYQNAYFLLFPSHTENFGNVVVESLICGTPVLASRGTPWEILQKEKIGLWVDNDADTLQMAIDEVLEIDEETYNAMRDRAKEIGNQKFNILNNFNKWEDFYLSMISL